MVALQTLVDFLVSKNHQLLQEGNLKANIEIRGPRNGDDAAQDQLTFFNTKAGESVFEKILNCKASLIILDTELDFSRVKFPQAATVVKAHNARTVITEVGKSFFLSQAKIGISEKATIHSSVVLGQNCAVSSGVVIEENVQIGSSCIIEPNVYIQANVRIGNNVHIKANTVIGGNGFGYVKTDAGEYEHMPHFGSVIIEDNVHIGSNTCIDRGSLSDTILKRGCKIDNLVHIAHNVIIGENAMVIANAMVAGSAEIGANSWIAPSASIKNGITVGENSVVGMASLVLKTVPANTTVAGVPAKPLEK